MKLIQSIFTIICMFFISYGINAQNCSGLSGVINTYSPVTICGNLPNCGTVTMQKN